MADMMIQKKRRKGRSCSDMMRNGINNRSVRRRKQEGVMAGLMLKKAHTHRVVPEYDASSMVGLMLKKEKKN
jgi:hypothetical protein